MRLEPPQFRFTPDRDTVSEDVFCGVCGTKTDQTKCNGSRNYIESMSGFKSEYDLYLCPNHNEGWHIKAVYLIHEGNATESKILRWLLNLEAQFYIITKLNKNGDM